VPYGNRRATIADVGRLANVSVKTVSRVFNAAPHVSGAVEQRVRAAAAELDYHPNVFAQALVRRRSHLIGLVYEGSSTSYVVELQKGMIERLDGERYRMVVVPIKSGIRSAGELLGLLQAAAIDSVVVAPPLSDHLELLALLDKVGIHYARVGPSLALDVGPSTMFDDVAAARASAAYLFGCGHRDIAVITGDPTQPSSDTRLLGYAQAHHEAGVVMRPDRIETGMSTREGGHAAARRLLTGDDRPTALLAMSDDMAAGAMLAARDIGLSVPAELSIVGFDDSETSRMTWPQLTTVRQPVFDMAIAATGMVIAQLDGRPFISHRHHSFELVVRASTAPPAH